MEEQSPLLNRRTVIGGIAGLGGLLLISCSREAGSDTSAPMQNAALPSQTGATAVSAMTVYRDPSCGCCKAWATIARQSGYQVSMVNDADMPALKKRLGVPDELRSCHTAVVAGYVVEGHVPLDAVRRLVSAKPAIKGIAVPGMPRGSPGMEMPNGIKDAFQVLAFDAAGKVTPFVF